MPKHITAWAWRIAKQGKLEDAVTCYKQALLLKPDFAEAHNNLANVDRKQKRVDEAVAGYQRALALRPGYAEAHYNLAVAFYEQKRFAEAVDCFEKALTLKSDYADAYSGLGVARYEQRLLAESVALHETAIRLAPEIAESHNNLGMTLVEQGKLAEAEACYRHALKLKRDYPGACNNLAVLLADQGRLEEATPLFHEALRLKPDYAEAYTNLSYVHYFRGDFDSWWSIYDWRWKCRSCLPPLLPPPYWDGSSLEGKTILLFVEQGLGDTIQFIRYAPLVKQRGATVALLCQPSMVRLLATCEGIDQIVPKGVDPPAADVRIPLMSLPRAFRTTLADIPAQVPYLSADPELRLRWGEPLKRMDGFKIGIAWQGNPYHLRDEQRSAPLAAFEPLAKVSGVRWSACNKALAASNCPS